MARGFAPRLDEETAAVKASALDQEEIELWRQLKRTRDFHARISEKRAFLVELQERRKSVRATYAEALAAVECLADEVNFVQQQERELEHDIAVLKESNRILQQAAPSAGPWSPPMAALARPVVNSEDFLADERARRESVQLLHEQILHLREHLSRLSDEKVALQRRQQVLFDQQRAAQQDRNQLLISLQDDRRSINDLRGDRIRLSEEKLLLSRAITEVLLEAQRQAQGPSDPSRWAASSPFRTEFGASDALDWADGRSAAPAPTGPEWVTATRSPQSGFSDWTATGRSPFSSSVTEWAGRIREPQLVAATELGRS